QPAEAAIALVELRRDFAELPAAREHIDGVWTNLVEGDLSKDLMQHAERLEQAASLQNDKQYGEALAIYQEIAGASPDSPAGTFAQSEIPAIERRLATQSGDESSDADEPAGNGDSAADAPSEYDVKRAASYLKLAKVFRDKKPEK